jgi:hypothetical protein
MATRKKSDDQPKLAPAAESDDPAVKFRLAELEAARANDDDAGVKAALDTLAELGFQAS